MEPEYALLSAVGSYVSWWNLSCFDYLRDNPGGRHTVFATNESYKDTKREVSAASSPVKRRRWPFLKSVISSDMKRTYRSNFKQGNVYIVDL